ncbi:MAG: hypothetical protein DRG78_15430 [Epsilonproteobacteria bacterium]|nr:MAG: hypothetical protein DRG78_15430 [Campylobacterota bacterium]
MKKYNYLFSILFILSVGFGIFDWKVDGFDFLKAQDYKFYFQSWISFAGSIFSIIMAITTYLLYKKSEIISLKLVSLSFVLISVSYGIIAYHTSYCKMCSDLSLCGASHSYPNYIILISLIILVITLLFVDNKLKISLIKTFSYGLIVATIFLIIILFLSINYMETPDIIPYIFSAVNMQGFVFIFPLIFSLLIFIYFKNTYKLTSVITFIFFLVILGFIPQAYHIFSCTECHNMECSEFYIASGLIMFIAVGLIFYAINLQLKNKEE